MKKKKLDTVRGYLTVSNFLTVTLIFLLAYFQYRKLALLITGSFLISNSSTVKKYSSGLVEEELRYEKFYKKTFPVLYYTLRPLMLLGSLGFCYSVSAHDINIIESFYRNPMLDLNNLPEIKSLETRVLFFSLIFFPATLLQILISIYIIHHANNNNSKEASMYWNLFKMAGMYVKKVVLPTTAALVGGRLAADIPHVPANEYSNFVHTQTPFGKGYDVEIGSALLKAQADLLQSKVGFDQMLRKVNQYAAETYAAFGGRAGPIITPQVLRDMLVDPEIREVVDRTATYIERQAFGISLVPPGFIQETAESGARYVLDHTIDFRDRKIEEINEYLEWAWEHGKAKWKTEGISIPEVDEDGDIPAEPRPGTPAARATRDQDIRDGRRRNVR